MGDSFLPSTEMLVWRWQTHFPGPIWLVTLALVAAVAWIIRCYRLEMQGHRRRMTYTLLLLRLLVVGVLTVMFSGLELVVEHLGASQVAVVIDDSESMGVADVKGNDGASSRWQQVQQALAQRHRTQLASVGQRYELNWYTLSQSVQNLGRSSGSLELDARLDQLERMAPQGKQSRLGEGLRQLLRLNRLSPPAAVILFSDGITTQGDSLSQMASWAGTEGIPIFTVGVGDPKPPVDWELRDLLAESVVFVNDRLEFRVKLVGQGLSGKTATIELLPSQDDDESKPLDSQQVLTPSDGEPTLVTLSHQPTQPGVYRYRLRVKPDTQESTTANNQVISQPIRVLKDKIRLFYAERVPRFEYRFLKTLLEREAGIDFRGYLLDADPEHAEQDRVMESTFPVQKEDLFAYDVIMLGGLKPDDLDRDQQRWVAEFVEEKGGGLVLIAGADHESGFQHLPWRDTPLRPLIPFEINDKAVGSSGDDKKASAGNGSPTYQPRPTSAGWLRPCLRFLADQQENEALWPKLSPWYTRHQLGSVRPGAGRPVDWSACLLVPAEPLVAPAHWNREASPK